MELEHYLEPEENESNQKRESLESSGEQAVQGLRKHVETFVLIQKEKKKGKSQLGFKWHKVPQLD